jgi:hypothetical protein
MSFKMRGNTDIPEQVLAAITRHVRKAVANAVGAHESGQEDAVALATNGDLGNDRCVPPSGLPARADHFGGSFPGQVLHYESSDHT